MKVHLTPRPFGLTQAGNDNQQLKPMTQKTDEALEGEVETVVTDAGYSNGEQIGHLQSSEYDVAVPSNRTAKNQGAGEYFQKSDSTYLWEKDAYRCPPEADDPPHGQR